MSSKAWTIIGSGFGIYGYLPALAEVTDDALFLPERYREKLLLRPELSHLEHRVTWITNDHEIFEQVDSIILAVPPNIQQQKILELINYEKIQHFLLEKPVAASPSASQNVLELLKSRGKDVRIGYTFFYAKWFDGFRFPFAHNASKVTFNWSFRAHHFSNQIDTWKSKHSLGGGPLRFYGIHLLALASSLGFDAVDYSVLKPDETDEPTCWHAMLLGPELPPCELNVHTNSDEMKFQVNAVLDGKQKILIDLSQPFALERESSLDIRVGALTRLLGEVNKSTVNSFEIYERVNTLWKMVEARN